MSDTEIEAMRLGVPTENVRELLDALRSEGDGMTPENVRTLVGLWGDFSESYRSSWLVPSGLLGNFAGWLINRNKVGAP